MDLPLELLEARTKFTKTVTGTLSIDELNFSLIRVDSTAGAVALTLPAATVAMDGLRAEILDVAGNALTIICAAGFGGAGAGDDTLTLERGEKCEVYCDVGTVNSVTVAGWYFTHSGQAT